MKTLSRTLILGAGALSAALMLSTPVSATEGNTARAGGDRFVQVGGHRGQGRGPRSEFRGPRRDAGVHRGHFRGPRGYSRGHYRHGPRQWRGYGHWRGHRQWRGHRPYWRRYGHHPRYGHRYGYGYGYLGYGTGLVIRLH
ncbi:MAG TPA: hypothetical protein VLS27_15820 [Gammaproteobacteria bacterium]|nr:hypothetical protein [Gammaproteobacteria bacterium]